MSALIEALDQLAIGYPAFRVLCLLQGSQVKAAAGIVPMLARMHGLLRLSSLLCPIMGQGEDVVAGESC